MWSAYRPGPGGIWPQIIEKYLVWFKLLTIVAIALIVGLRFSSIGAPLATLTCAPPPTWSPSGSGLAR